MNNENFRILNNFLGFGDPHSPTWFIGLEEAGAWNTSIQKFLTDIERYKQKQFFYEPGEILGDHSDYGRKYTKVYDIMSKLMVALKNPENKINSDWSIYRYEKLLQQGDRTFLVNLYPIGKKHLSDWPSEYKDLFGFAKTDKKEYFDTVEKHRFPLIRKTWEEYAPEFTICFGKAGWNDFEELFVLQNSDYTLQEPFKIYHTEQIIPTPFFWPPPMSNERIIDLVNIIKSHKWF